MTHPTIESISPFFIVDRVDRAIEFYRDKLGFRVTAQQSVADRLFFAIVARDNVMLFLKGSGKALPNPTRHSWARWDAYLYVPDPDALAAEFEDRGVSFSDSLKDTHDGLRGFELIDPDGYVLFFGRPLSSGHKID